MTQLEHYLKAIAWLLPRDVDKPDVLAELAGHLESMMEQRAAELGRALTEQEEQAVLAAYGDPFDVATRYGRKNAGFAFGPIRIITPAAFPVYIGVLAFVVAANVVSFAVEVIVDPAPLWPRLLRLVAALVVLVVAITVVFAGVGTFLERSRRGGAEAWLFWTPYLKYVPRWYSVSGAITLGISALAWLWWWEVWPAAPVALFGAAAATLVLTPDWLFFERTLLVLLLAGVALRLVTLVRPELDWLPPFGRLALNVVAVALVLPMLRDAPFIVAEAAGSAAEEFAATFDRGLRGVIRGFGLYWVINALWLGFVCTGYARYHANRKRRAIRDR